MVYVMLHTNRTFTDEFYPFFEIIYAIEILFILIFYALAPVAFYMLWNARPFHRNMRLSLCNLVVQGLIGSTARFIFIYNQYAGEGPLEERPSVIVASLLRCSMMEAFVGAFFLFSVERMVATFAWSWYEKACPRTLIVFFALETCALIYSWTWAIFLVLEIVQSKGLLIGFACSAMVGISIGIFVIAVNWRASVRMKGGAHINGYSVARTFQIRENLVILKALTKVAVSVMVLNVPLFVLSLCHLLLPNFTERMFSRALFDLIISVYPAMIITFIPLSDVIFERALKRMPLGELLFRILYVLHGRFLIENKQKVRVSDTEQYFRMLAASWNA